MLHRIYFSLGIFDKIQKKLYERRGVMKIVTVIDSFKGSLSSMEAGRAATEGIRRVDPQADFGGRRRRYGSGPGGRYGWQALSGDSDGPVGKNGEL